MLPETSLELTDPWETPPIALDAELVETSQRLVSLSDAADNNLEPPRVELKEKRQDPHVAILEQRNQYLFNRNIVLVAKVAALEASNLRLHEQISALRHPKRDDRPWYLRWL